MAEKGILVRKSGTFQCNPKHFRSASDVRVAHAPNVCGRTPILALHARVHNALPERALCVGTRVTRNGRTRVNGIFVLSLRANTPAAGGLPPSLSGSPPRGLAPCPTGPFSTHFP